MIQPTIGRIVLYYPGGKTQVDKEEQPFAAQIAYVHSDRMVNLGFLDHRGQSGAQTSVCLVQDGEPLPEHGFCCWMPYQIQQAAEQEKPAKKGK